MSANGPTADELTARMAQLLLVFVPLQPHLINAGGVAELKPYYEGKQQKKHSTNAAPKVSNKALNTKPTHYARSDTPIQKRSKNRNR